MQPAQLYDSAATMFSPDGRIYQVEYAREAVKRGTTAVGVTFPDGVVLVVDKRIGSRLIEAKQVEKLYKVDHHIGVASSGLVGDARSLVARARTAAQQNKVVYQEPIPIAQLVKDLSDLQQQYTQNGGVRPFGTAFLVGGVDVDGQVRLFETDPSGAVVAYRASAIGAGRATAMEFLEENFKADAMTKAKAIDLALKALLKHQEAGEGGPAGAPNADMVLVTRKEGYEKLPADEVQRHIERVRG